MGERKMWCGFVNGKPYAEPTYDLYCGAGEDVMITEMFRSKREAAKRHEDVPQVTVKWNDDAS